MRHCQDAVSLERSVKTLKPKPLYSIKVYAYLSLLQVKDSKPPFVVTRLGPVNLHLRIFRVKTLKNPLPHAGVRVQKIK